MTETRQRPPGIALIALAWIIFIASVILAELPHWTDKLVVLFNFSYYAVVYSIPFTILIAPLVLIILVLIRRRAFKPATRTLLATSPALLAAIFTLAELMLHYPNSRTRFKGMMAHDLPTNAASFKAFHSGGGFIDYLDMYYFQTSKDEIDSLINARNYSPYPRPLSAEWPEWPLPVGGTRPPRGWPDPSTWEGVQTFQCDTNTWFYYIITDQSRTQVFVVAGCI